MGTSVISSNEHASVAVCICTYQRHEGLQRLLAALDGQQFRLSTQPSIQVIVVDNSPAGDAQSLVQSHRGRWPLSYLQEPRKGISHARNTGLSAVAQYTDFVAMIDDDVTPANDWLDNLLDAQARSGADIIIGPTTPEFPAGTPLWISSSEFFLKPQNQAQLADLDPDPPGATCNVLFNASLVGRPEMNFDPALTLSGGEDKLLFQNLKMRGYRFAWALRAHARESFPPERATLGYMLREAYRRGSVKFYIKRRLKSRSPTKSLGLALRLSGRSILQMSRDVFLLLVNLPRGHSAWLTFALRLADSVGTIAGVLHIPNRHYRPDGT